MGLADHGPVDLVDPWSNVSGVPRSSGSGIPRSSGSGRPLVQWI